MRALVLGTQSFIDGGTKVGSQHLAQALAAAGWAVDYVPTLSSPMDVIGRQRHARLARAWGGGLRERSVGISPGLTEWSVQSFFPAHRWFLRWPWQLKAYGHRCPAALRNVQFDACIADVAPNMLLLHQITAHAKVCRLNDWPRGFARDLHPVLVNALESMVGSACFDEVWAVSQPLAEYAHALNPQARVEQIPNGVEASMLVPLSHDHPIARRPRSAVYVGGLTAWLDIGLLAQVAQLLPDWTFDVHAPGAPPQHGWPANLRWCGAVARNELPAVLQSHEVGLIPFREADGRMRYVERPLKFYEYIAAGLGVASTDLGALRHGMGDLACYGNGAQAFADAVVRAREQAQARSPGFADGFVQAHDWSARAQTMLARLEILLA
ncbi:glycosyltransferase [Acidovorax sp. NCPPB 3576]|uniref:glycosyltransferase n=1 Tax=Acidovorax sp. NCPPB 3576 TaxID=2940488 RepID=UPI00234AD931|nr:glycosyltransferase [Acidovorax sp. NCPPB 3576]WCM89335.1 glycosyltransferase [Acidovorax sp. NCPPB 3576]